MPRALPRGRVAEMDSENPWIGRASIRHHLPIIPSLPSAVRKEFAITCRSDWAQGWLQSKSENRCAATFHLLSS